MSYTTYRYENRKKRGEKPFPIKKRSLEQVYQFTKEYILKTEQSLVTAEEIAEEMQVKVEQVRQALHKLNLEGLVSQKKNFPPHDSKRDSWGGWDSSWCASSYSILKEVAPKIRILLIDDERDLAKIINPETSTPFKDYSGHTARTYQEGLDYLNNEKFDILLLDHDLGDMPQTPNSVDYFAGPIKEKTGYDIMCYLEENPQFAPPTIYLVTANPVGRKRMLQVIEKMEERGHVKKHGWIR